MLLAATSNSSSERLPGQHDLVLHADSEQGGKKPKSSPLCWGNAQFLPQTPNQCFATHIPLEWAPEGLVSSPAMKNSLPQQIS